MKKILCMILIICFSVSLFAQTFGEKKYPYFTVAEAKKVLKDDATLTLRGKLIEKLRSDEYLFSDGTGEVKVEIDDDVWRGLSVTAEDEVVITGEVDKHVRFIIDVETIEKAEKAINL